MAPRLARRHSPLSAMLRTSPGGIPPQLTTCNVVSRAVLSQCSIGPGVKRGNNFVQLLFSAASVE